MSDRERLWATVAIWAAFVILLGTFLTSAVAPYARIQDDTLFAITLVISATTGLATVGVWGGFLRGKRHGLPGRLRRTSRSARIASE